MRAVRADRPARSCRRRTRCRTASSRWACRAASRCDRRRSSAGSCPSSPPPTRSSPARRPRRGSPRAASRSRAARDRGRRVPTAAQPSNSDQPPPTRLLAGACHTSRSPFIAPPYDPILRMRRIMLRRGSRVNSNRAEPPAYAQMFASGARLKGSRQQRASLREHSSGGSSDATSTVGVLVCGIWSRFRTRRSRLPRLRRERRSAPRTHRTREA